MYVNIQVSHTIHIIDFIQTLYKIQHNSTGIHSILYVFVFFWCNEYKYIIHAIHGNMLYILLYVNAEIMIMVKYNKMNEIFLTLLDFLLQYHTITFLKNANINIYQPLRAHNNKNQMASEIRLIVLNINIFFYSVCDKLVIKICNLIQKIFEILCI